MERGITFMASVSPDSPTWGVVIIGRNEGKRLAKCLNSAPQNCTTVYVDSGSTDDSVSLARSYASVSIVELDSDRPFTAARARNAGLRRIVNLVQDPQYVQFIDGDSELIQGWTRNALEFLESHTDVAAVSGLLHERDPGSSIYNWLCEREWAGPHGEVRACGGIAMMRVSAVLAVGGFREALIAGEEPELCARLRAAGWLIWRLNSDMALHDAAMTHFSQWWRRAVRSGHALSQSRYLNREVLAASGNWETKRIWLWVAIIPLTCAIASLAIWPWGVLTWLVYPLQIVRQIVRNSGSMRDRTVSAVFQMLARFAEAFGHLAFLRARFLGRQPHLIEYK